MRKWLSLLVVSLGTFMLLIDVTIVRLFLAPAILELLGEQAWWWPGRGKATAPPHGAVVAWAVPGGPDRGREP